MKKKEMSCAEKIPKKLKKHGDVRVDNYFWMRLTDEQKNSKNKDEQTKKVIEYLNSENKYYEEKTSHTKSFESKLFEEMKGRIKKDDQSVPYIKNGYYYKTKFDKESQYPVFLRKKDEKKSKWEKVIDMDKASKGFDYFHHSSVSVSPNNQLLAFSVDVVGRNLFSIQVKKLSTGKFYPEKIENTTGEIVWAGDNKTFFYIKKDLTTLRPYAVYKHVLGTDTSEDKLVFEEKDVTFALNLDQTNNNKYIIITSWNTISTEQRILEKNSPDGDFRIIQKRQKNLEYYVDNNDGFFYILSNENNSLNFKISKTSENKTEKENWVDFIEYRKGIYLEDFLLFENYIVLQEKEKGLSRFRVLSYDGKKDFYLPFNEETYSISISTNFEFESSVFRYSYESMTTPTSIIDFNMDKQTKEIKKEQEVLGGFKKEDYKTKRLWVNSRDGKKIAVSMVYHKNTKLNENTPILLYGYGSYGITIDDVFSSSRLSLLNRGFVWATAHIRGGEYLGRKWYEDGKMLKKKNTFNDFVDCSLFLIKNNYTSEKHLYAMGGSAGGLLVGSVVNTNSDLYNGAVAQVPFVDVVSTILDETLPLTTGEYDEWGNPNDKKYYDYMKSYSPYDQVKKQKYTNLFVSTGFHDSQVQYWEPAKWVAKLRELKTDNNFLFLKTNMKAGHGGASGRFDSLKETAEEYTFLLMLEDKIDKF